MIFVVQKSKTLPNFQIRKWERNKESCRHSGRVVEAPIIVEPVVVQDPPVIVPVEVTDVEVAIGVAEIYKTSSLPPPLEAIAISELNRIRHDNTLMFCTKYIHFL